MHDFMEENQVKASYGITRVTNPQTGETVQWGTESTANLWISNRIGAGSVVLHKEVLETVGLHDPHLSLTRICDWDLWLRIVDRYEFVPTGIIFTFEYGTTQADSLGNVFKLDLWFVREWQQSREKKSLLPEVYEDFNVIGCGKSNSVYFGMCLKEHYLQYQKKQWFDRGALEHISSIQFNTARKRVMVLVPSPDASFMAFLRYDGENCTFAYVRGDMVDLIQLALTDIVVFGRSFWGHTPMAELCDTLGIPCYYYVDDNFREIALDEDNAGIRDMAKATTAETMKVFQGVIVTSKPLREYFIRERIHRNVIVVDPVFRNTIPQQQRNIPFTVGFMGGQFRQGVLKSCVLPALVKLSKQQPIRLVLPCLEEEKEDLFLLGTDNLEIIPFIRNLNFEYLLNTYHEIGVDVLIHCGPNLRNNLYKNKNVLLNAVTLGVPLLVSDVEPYCYRETGEPDRDYLLVRNTPDAWYKALKSVAKSPVLRQEIYTAAQQYCSVRYDTSNAWVRLDKELRKHTWHDEFYYLRRYEKLCIWLMQRGAGGAAAINAPARRLYIPENLSCSNEMVLPRRFGFTSSVASIHEIGLLFAVFGECTGTVWVRIYRKGEEKPLAERSIPVEQLAHDTYTNLYLKDPIRVSIDELLYLELDVQYEQKNGYVAVFEDRGRRTFWYKVFNKLGHPLPGKNALFVDCRS